MFNSASKILKILTWILMGITIIFALIFYLGGIKEGTEGTRIEEPNITQTFLVWSYILLFVTLGITVVFSALNFIANPKGGKKSLWFLLGGGLILLIAFILSDGTVLDMPFYDGKDNVPKILKFVDTTMFTAYMLAGVAFVAIVYSSVAKLFVKDK